MVTVGPSDPILTSGWVWNSVSLWKRQKEKRLNLCTATKL